MTKDEFKKLKKGDRFTHPQFPTVEFQVGVIHTWNEWPDGPGTKPIQVTVIIETTDGRILKIDDKDVKRITKVE